MERQIFPTRQYAEREVRSAWRDFTLLLAWLTCLFAASWLDAVFGRGVPLAAILWGFLAPFLVWNALMGMTAFLQHTSPRIPWFRTLAEARLVKTQAELATFVRYPRWYDVLSHNIMHHPAHHVNARIPWFRLSSAQRRLDQILGADGVVASIGPKYVLDLTRQCQLYDYERHHWLDFPVDQLRMIVTRIAAQPLVPQNSSRRFKSRAVLPAVRERGAG